MKRKTGGFAYGPTPRPRRGIIRRMLTGIVLALLVVFLFTVAFIGVRCYGQGRANRGSPVDGVPSNITGYTRPEAFTYLTLPEWFIVFSTQEYAQFIQKNSPTDFPYLRSVGQYWGYYDSMCQVTRSSYGFEGGYHMMLGVIGASFTIESLLRSAYENTLGRLSAWTAARQTPEDLFAAKAALDYATFMRSVPWYEFPFVGKLRQLWTEVPWSGPDPFRKWERRLALTTEYTVKAAYGWVLGMATRGAYGPEDLKVYGRIENASDAAFRTPQVEKIAQTGAGAYIVRLPRYEAFTRASVALIGTGARFVDVAGNDEILVTALAPAALAERSLRNVRVVASRPVLTNRARKRLALRVTVTELHRALTELRNAGANIEHVYDY